MDNLLKYNLTPNLFFYLSSKSVGKLLNNTGDKTSSKNDKKIGSKFLFVIGTNKFMTCCRVQQFFMYSRTKGLLFCLENNTLSSRGNR
jgi:hypothetical protein